MIANGDLLEHAEVFGNWYGTGAAETRRALAGGDDVVLVIDVQGARKVRNAGFEHVGIFVLPPSFEVLEDRLRRRSKDSEVQIQRRLAVAQQEVAAVAEYDYVVINDEVDSAVARLRAIVEAERARLRAMQPEADAIIERFRAAPGASDSEAGTAMSLIALGITGGIGAYKADRGRTRSAEARPRGRRAS